MNNNKRMILNKIDKIEAIPCFPMPESECTRLLAKVNKENKRMVFGDAFRHPLKFAHVCFSVLTDWQSQFFTLSDNACQSKKTISVSPNVWTGQGPCIPLQTDS